jgi:hypothetical protein
MNQSSNPAVSSGLELRWRDYLLCHGQDTVEFWSKLLQQNRKILFVLGFGFDPRMCLGIDTLLQVMGSSQLSMLLLRGTESLTLVSPDHKNMVDHNEARWSEIKSLTTAQEEVVEMVSHDGRPVGPRNVCSLFDTTVDIGKFTDVIVDISALPRHIYIPLITKLISTCDNWKQQGKIAPNLHAIIAENAVTDRAIVKEQLKEDAAYMHGYSRDLESAALESIPKVWFPILGEDRVEHLERIAKLVNPHEICPVVPWPSGDPRRGDNIVQEYHQLLFDRFRVEPKNIVYASERNPFQAYRQIVQTAVHYDKALKRLGGSRTVISAVGSKLLSVGALLAAYELRQMQCRIAVSYVQSQGYKILEEGELPKSADLCTVWLTGECYDE